MNIFLLCSVRGRFIRMLNYGFSYYYTRLRAEQFTSFHFIDFALASILDSYFVRLMALIGTNLITRCDLYTNLVE
ncbi:hypothetical protein BLOT_002110 [Blomia tropicalis]|nr:hypothetical protein BLOT_002110 [Blomia tropicalis]